MATVKALTKATQHILLKAMEVGNPSNGSWEAAEDASRDAVAVPFLFQKHQMGGLFVEDLE